MNLNELTNEEIRLLDMGYPWLYEYLFKRGAHRHEKSDREILHMGFSAAFIECYRSMESLFNSRRRQKLALRAEIRARREERARETEKELDKIREEEAAGRPRMWETS